MCETGPDPLSLLKGKSLLKSGISKAILANTRCPPQKDKTPENTLSLDQEIHSWDESLEV